MKKLNAFVAAISLGLTVSFAVLPVASAHSTLNVGNAHAMYAHYTAAGAHEYQKHTSTDDPKRYKQHEECKAVRGFTSQGTGTSVPEPTAPGTTAPQTPIVGETFDVPANCAFSLEDNIQVQNPVAPALTALIVRAGLATLPILPSTDVTCTLFRKSYYNSGTITSIATDTQTIGALQQSATFPLSAFVSPITSEYSGYDGYGYRFPVHYFVACSQTGFVCPTNVTIGNSAVCSVGNFINVNNPNIALSVSSTGNVVVGKSYPTSSSEEYDSDGSYNTRGIKHIKR